MRYSIISPTTMSIRSGHTTSDAKIGTLSANVPAEGEELWIATTGTSTCYVGDQWLHILKMGGQPIDGWVAVIHMGYKYCTLTDNGVTPPPSGDAPKAVKATVFFDDGTSQDLFPVV